MVVMMMSLLLLTGVLDERGEINRQVLGPIVFADKVILFD